MIASILVLAATLSSDALGDFFTIPNWLPSSVSSHETIGSDPLATTGWYVNEVTNGVVLADTWKIYDGTVLVQDYTPPEYYEEVGWLIVPPPESLYPIKYQQETIPHYIDEGQDADYLTWVSAYVDGEGLPPWFITFEAFRDKTIQPIATGRRVPRACRLSPVNQASVNASFEGVFERMYYASQAQSNVWSIATYGSPTRKQFRFDLPTEYPMFEYSTNRVVRSRRLNEYDALTNLEHYVRGDLYYNYSQASVVRPGWIERGSLWWSTTGAAIPDVFFPSFGWVTEPTMSGPSWTGVCATFAHLWDDDVWKIRSGEPYINGPSRVLMERLSLGQPSREYTPFRCEWDNQGVTMRGLIETNYTHADGWAITNQTRRLQSDHICCLNQVLGLMDRTYHLPTVVYPTVGTNENYHNVSRVIGHCTASVSKNASPYGYDVIPGEITWESPTSTNFVYRSSATSSGTAYHWRVGETATSADVVAGSEMTIATPDDDTVERMFRAAYDDGFIPAEDGGDFTLMFTPSLVNGQPAYNVTIEHDGSWATHEGGWVWQGNVAASEDISSIDILLVTTYDRQYSYLRTIGDVTLGATQPGRDALVTDRDALNKYASVRCFKYRTGDDIALSLSEFAYASGNSLGYKSVTANYTQRSQLLGAVGTAQSDLYARLVQAYGFAPTAWQSIIPIDSSDVSRIVQSVHFPDDVEMTITPKLNLVTIVKGFVVDSLDMTIAEVITHGGEAPIEGYSDLFTVGLSVTMSHDSPSETERPGIALDGKIGVLTRTDWAWKTLKRTDN